MDNFSLSLVVGLSCIIQGAAMFFLGLCYIRLTVRVIELEDLVGIHERNSGKARTDHSEAS
jgi:hypothetical protein